MATAPQTAALHRANGAQNLRKNLREADSQYLGRDVPRREPNIVDAEGSFVFDSRGRRYIDFMMGWCVGNLGWRHRAILEAVHRYDGPDYVDPAFLFEPWVELAELLAEVTPGRLQKSFRATGGTEAVEIAIQAAVAHTKRTKFITLEGCYHGNSIGTRAIAGEKAGGRAKVKQPTASQVAPPLNGETVKAIEQLLQKGDVAAFLAEPVVCNLGVVVPEADFLLSVQKLCRDHGALFIMDEVATGFGRTGALFASELYEVEPDILCLAKAITNGVAPLGATVMTPEVAASFETQGFYTTYGWHPLGVTAAIATVRYYTRNHDRLMRNVSAAGDYMRQRLEAIQYGRDAQVRAQGLAIGIDLGDAEYAAQVRERCRQEGLLITAEGTAAVLFPALTIDRRTAAEALDIFEGCFTRPVNPKALQ